MLRRCSGVWGASRIACLETEFVARVGPLLSHQMQLNGLCRSPGALASKFLCFFSSILDLSLHRPCVPSGVPVDAEQIFRVAASVGSCFSSGRETRMWNVCEGL